jgi:hypothetical protein
MFHGESFAIDTKIKLESIWRSGNQVIGEVIGEVIQVMGKVIGSTGKTRV